MPELQGQLMVDDGPLVPRPQESAATPMELLSMVTANGAGIEVLERFMQLYERSRADERAEAFAADFVRMKPRLPKVIRHKLNDQTGKKYAPLEDINEQVDPILEQFGFGTSTKIIAQDENSVTVQAELWHRNRHVETTQIRMPLDDTGIAGKVNKTKPWALSSSVSYAKRVAICALLNVSTGDDVDGNGSSGSSVPRDWLQERLGWIESANANELQKIFADAFKKAHSANDQQAEKAIISAKDARKRELGL